VGSPTLMLRPDLPRELWAYLLASLVNMVGVGMTMPFGAIYLHNVRGISLGVVGLVMATLAGASFAGSFVGGHLADRFGPRRTLIAALVTAAMGLAAFGFVQEWWQAVPALAVAGLGIGIFGPAHAHILATLAGIERRHAVFSVQRLLDNLGLGLGGILGGLIAVESEPSTYTALFLADAATALSFALVLPFMALGAAAPKLDRSRRREGGGYGEVLRQGLVLRVIALNFAFTLLGYGMFEFALPVFAVNETGIDERGVGLLFALNTAVVVLAQLPVSRLLRRRRRMQALAGMSVAWAGAWLAVLAAGGLDSATWSLAVIAAGVGVFAVGECVLAIPSALVADLASDELRGRSLGLIPASSVAGMMVGQPLIGVLLATAPGLAWGASAAALGAVAIASLSLDRSLPERLGSVTPTSLSPEPALASGDSVVR